MHNYLQAPILYDALDDGGEFAGVFAAIVARTGEAHFRPATDNLGPGTSVCRRIVAVAVLVRRYNDLTASVFQ